MHRFAIVIGTTLVVLVSASVWASKVGSWRQTSNSDFSKGEFAHTVLSDRGTIRLSRELVPWSDLSADFIWDLAQDPNGNLYAATGEEGKIFKITPDGEPSLLYDSSDQQHIFSLALAPDGTLYAGTAPNGLVLKITADGDSTTHFSTEKHYVWDLVVDPDGNLYAATGTGAEVFRITPDGTGQSLYRSKQKHMLSLALGSDGMLYAGCDGDGLVYRINSQGKAFVLYDAPQQEIRTLLAAADGTVYVGTSRPTSTPPRTAPSTQSTRSSSTSSSRPTGTLSSTAEDSEKQPAQVRSASTTRLSRKSSKSRSSSSRVSSGSNVVYRIGSDGSVRQIFQQRVLMLSLVEQKRSLLVGTGQSGQLFELDHQNRSYCELARLDHGEILCMIQRPDGTAVLGMGDPGKLYVLKPGYTSEGSYVSQVFDARMTSHWGRVQWRGQVPHGTKITLAVRSGNVQKPDETWSEWSAELLDPQTAQAACPPARFLQFRATLSRVPGSSPELTPALDSVLVRHMTANQPPEVTSVKVPDIGAGDGKTRTTKFKIKWQAKDPNQDQLEYTLSFRKDGWKNWIQLAKKQTKREYSWTTESVPEGHYQLRVLASDRPDNPPEKTLTAGRNSELFVIDHAPPAVELNRSGSGAQQVTFEAKATDRLTRITRASYSIDSGQWTPIFPVDQLFDSSRESFRFATKDLGPGTHLIMLRVVDAAGNIGSRDLVFTVENSAN